MNIIVRPYDGKACYCRPDTTWERENKDLYLPESISAVDWTPIVFARISKAGKCIGAKFASRYYDALNFGLLLYCNSEGWKESECRDSAFTSCVDHTSWLPFPLYNPVVFENEENRYEVYKDDNLLFTTGNGTMLKDCIEMIEDTICTASAYTSLRIGDLIAVELAPPTTLGVREDKVSEVKGRFCENELFARKIIF